MKKQIIGACAILLASTPSLFAMDANMTIDTNLMFGSRGQAVINLQNFLAEKGFLSASARGSFGMMTKKALMKYQSENGINATGYFGPMTRMSINNMLKMNSGGMMNDNKMQDKKEEMGVMVGGAAMLPSRDIVDNAVLANNVTTVVAAVKAAGLVDTLKSKGPFTVFAPDNNAFDKLPAGTVTSLLTAEKKMDLTSILTYHVVAGRYTAADLTNGLTLKTVNGKNLIFTTDASGNIMINGTTKVLIKNVISSNGVTFVIDSVLIPSAN